MMRNFGRLSERNAALLIGVAGLAGVAWATAGTRYNRTNDAVTVVTGGSASTTTAAPPAPLAPTATTAATMAAAPVAVAVAEPVPYVLGTITWNLASDAPADKRVQITDSMNWVMNQLNTLTDYYGTVRTVYSAGTPTADASFLGQVRFGGQTNRRTAMHEMGHWLGSGGTNDFRSRVSGGAFNGWITALRIRGFDGPDARISSDGTHFWPYGMNYDNEFVEPQRTIAIVAAQRADMGYGDGTYAIVGNRRFQNRSSRMILDAGSGGNAVQRANASATSQVWKTGYVDGFVTLAAGNSKLALDSIGVTANAGATAMRAAVPTLPNQHWEMIPTDDGWFMLRNRGTGKCLDNNGNQGAGADMRLWACSGHPNQQWHLVR